MVSPIINGITISLCLGYIAVILVLTKGWRKLRPWKAPVNASFKTTVSIVIAARNEADNIGKTIDAILGQHYPKVLMELIIVDDHSTDNTSEIIASYASFGVRLIQLQESKKLNSYKKKAISEAIASAKGELIVATDADCYMGASWLSSIVSLYEEKNYKLISSPVVYDQETNDFERLQTVEFLCLIGIGAASIGIRQPSTCNGANLAYRRDVFYELGGFKGIDDLASGDDELFLHKVARRYPEAIAFCKSEEAIVYTAAKENLKEFIQQRRRWASKSTKYKNKRIVVLGVWIWLFNVMLLVDGTVTLFFTHSYTFFGLIILIKMVIEMVFAYPLLRFSGKKRLFWTLPILSIIHILYMIYIGIAGNTGRYQWKGRSVR